MVDITSLKVRLARLRLAGSKEVAERIRNKQKPVKEEEESQTRKATKEPGFGEYTKNTGDKRKKKNKLTRSDQKRGKTVKKKQKKYDLSKDDDIDVDVERELARERMLERSQASAENQPDIY